MMDQIAADQPIRIVIKNDIMQNVLFELQDGRLVWYTELTPAQRVHADKLLNASSNIQPPGVCSHGYDMGV